MLGFTPLAAATLADSGVSVVQSTFSVDESYFVAIGQVVTFSISRLSEPGTFSLTGLPHTRAISEAARHVVLSYAGQANHFNITMPVEAGSLASASQDASFNTTLATERGSFVSSGQDVRFAIKLAAATQTFTLSGQDASLKKDVLVVGASGAYAITVQGITSSIKFIAAHDDFTATEQGVTVIKAIQIAPVAATFNFTGQAALKAIREIGADTAYTFAGQTAYFTIAHPVQRGSFVVAGADALKGISELAPAVLFGLTGKDVGFALNISMRTDQATFAFSGQDARFVFVYNRSEFAGALTTAVTTAGNKVELIDETFNTATLQEPNTTNITLVTPNTVTLSSELNEAA